jgi:dTDP-4-amino-4,6-dideoxygalactose transaminase
MSDWAIPLSDLDYGAAEEEAVLRVVRSRWLSMGPEVQAFEGEFARMLGAGHAFAVSNATAGLHLCMLALGIGKGDEVIQPAVNFVATANMTVACGAVPVFADICGLAEPTIDPERVARLLTPRTKAVVVMHYGGYLGRMAALRDLCRERKVALIEDACHAVGAAYTGAGAGDLAGRMAGAIGDVSAFSFFGNKNLATGEGGMVVTNRDDLTESLRLLRSHGMTSLTWDRHKGHASSYGVVAHGYNYRLDELHAALGRAQLAKLAANNARRKAAARAYEERLGTLEGWILPFAGSGAEGSHHLMVAVAPDPGQRTEAADRLRAARIQTSLHYPCIADFSAFTPARSDGLEATRAFCGRALTLPLYPGLAKAGVDRVCDVLMGR